VQQAFDGDHELLERGLVEVVVLDQDRGVGRRQGILRVFDLLADGVAGQYEKNKKYKCISQCNHHGSLCRSARNISPHVSSQIDLQFDVGLDKGRRPVQVEAHASDESIID